MIRGGPVYYTEEQYSQKKGLRKAATATAFFLILFFIFIYVYDFILLYSVNIAFNRDFVFSRQYFVSAVRFFYNFLPHMSMIENSVIQILSVITSSLIIKAVYKIKLLDIFKKDTSLPSHSFDGELTEHRTVFYLRLFCIVYTLNLFCTILVSYIEKLFNGSGIKVPDVDLSFSSNNFGTLIVYFVSTIVVAPVLEEFVFRGLLLRILKPYGLWFSAIITAMMFALLHGNIPQGVGAFFIGIVFAIVAIKSGSVIPSMILHALNNLIPFTGSVVSNSKGDISKIYSGLVMVLLAFGVLSLFNCLKIFSLGKNEGTTLTFRQSNRIFFTSIPVIIYLIYELYLIVVSFVNLNS